ncbi:MAG: hypothetical protein QW478_03630, partial [Candidatus Micrarchaeaceae archaeon]
MEFLYKKENLSFDEIIILLNYNYDPDKKLILQLLKLVHKKFYNLNQHFLIYDVITKNIKNYDIQNNEKYLEFAFKNKLIDVIELLIINRAKVNNYSLAQAIKCYLFDNTNYLQLMLDYKLIDEKDKRYKELIENKDKIIEKDKISLLCELNCKGIIKFMLKEKKKEPNDFFYFANKYGNKKLVDFLIYKGANYWNLGLRGACEGGH